MVDAPPNKVDNEQPENQNGSPSDGDGASSTPPPDDASNDKILKRLLELNRTNNSVGSSNTYYSHFVTFTTSGLFFMLVGTAFLCAAYLTIGKTYAAMSFVFVVVGVAILLYGTGTQGIGRFASGQSAEHLARYNIALAGGAGLIAFCVAAGVIKYHEDMKQSFQIEQRYLRAQISGKGVAEDDIGHYLPDVLVNGLPEPALRHGDYIEVYLPYTVGEPKIFNIRVQLQMSKSEMQPSLSERPPPQVFKLKLLNGIDVEDDGEGGKRIENSGGFDFPTYPLRRPIILTDSSRPRPSLGDVAPK